MSSAHLKLGPFELHQPIGQGGMGVVWRGYHPEQRVEVAIKVMTGKQARDATYIEGFRNEVRAVAGLDHPSIIMVLDQGEVDAQAESRSGGVFVAGSPYLVMELASHGSLEDITSPLSWQHCKYILFGLLDALAHAHARGVTHRDIKPGNVLISSPEDPRPGLKLTDFGIAQAVEKRTESGSTESTTGTPHYMAPEQMRGLWRDYGPWTDLYAVGCLTYNLVCGRTPFEGDNFIQLAHSHLQLPPPALAPQIDVPPGLEAWIHRLMAKAPQQRFQCAADAAWALMMLDNTVPAQPVSTYEVALRGGNLHPQELRALILPPWERGHPPKADTSVDMTLVDALPGTQVTGMSGLDILPEWSPNEQTPNTTTPELLRPPMPTSWRRPAHEATSMRLVGAGLGLYGLRIIPLVDRLPDRDAIWQALLEVRQTQRAQLVALTGAAGTGKGRLVEWICERAHEFGAATSLHAYHSRSKTPADGLPSMLARHLRCMGLTREETQARLEKHLQAQGVTDPYEWLALTEMLSPMENHLRATSLSAMIRFGSPKERYALMLRFLARMGQERPVIVWLDDVQWAGDALGFAEYAMQAQALNPCPILFVLTARNEALAQEPVNQSALHDLLRQPDTIHRDIEPLAKVDRATLIQELLGLEGELAAQVEERTAGNPLFAVQLVGDWVQRGVLEVSDNGFVLRPGEEAILPDDLHQVWTAHLGRALSGLGPDAARALELAAVLGRQVSNDEWHQVCHHAGIHLTVDILHTLFSGRLATVEDGGWRFAHGMLRESLERMAREGDRLVPYHLACARMLLDKPEGQSGVAERLGRHLWSAGAYARALEPLLQGAQERRDTSDYRAARALLELRERAMTALGLPPEDPCWGQGWVMRSWIERLNWKFDEALTWAEHARQGAEMYGWTRILPEALWGLAWTTRQQGNWKHAEGLYQQASEHYKILDDVLGMAHCFKGLAIIARQRADLASAQALFERARLYYDRGGDQSGVASCLYGLGTVAHRAHDEPTAQALLQQALELHRHLGDQSEVANCLNVLAEVNRSQGDLDAAAAGYRAALKIHDAIGSGGGIIPRLNLCIVLLDHGHYQEAQTTLEASRPVIEQTGQRALLAFVHLALAMCAAALQQWPTWSHHLPTARQLLIDTAMVDHDVARIAHAAADIAMVARRRREAQDAYAIALDQWTRLGKTDEATECRERMDLLQGL